MRPATLAIALLGCGSTVEIGAGGNAGGEPATSTTTGEIGAGGAGGEPAMAGGGAELGAGGDGGAGGEQVRCLPDVIPCPEGLVCAAYCEVHELDPCSDRDAKKWICVEPDGAR